MNLRIILLAFIATMSCTASADEVYSWVDSKGVRHFSDKPPQGVERTSVRGEISSGELKRDKFNTMKPYTPPTPTKLIQPVTPAVAPEGTEPSNVPPPAQNQSGKRSLESDNQSGRGKQINDKTAKGGISTTSSVPSIASNQVQNPYNNAKN